MRHDARVQTRLTRGQEQVAATRGGRTARRVNDRENRTKPSKTKRPSDNVPRDVRANWAYPSSSTAPLGPLSPQLNEELALSYIPSVGCVLNERGIERSRVIYFDTWLLVWAAQGSLVSDHWGDAIEHCKALATQSVHQRGHSVCNVVYWPIAQLGIVLFDVQIFHAFLSLALLIHSLVDPRWINGGE